MCCGIRLITLLHCSQNRPDSVQDQIVGATEVLAACRAGKLPETIASRHQIILKAVIPKEVILKEVILKEVILKEISGGQAIAQTYKRLRRLGRAPDAFFSIHRDNRIRID
jgi:hypothetical protein